MDFDLRGRGLKVLVPSLRKLMVQFHLPAVLGELGTVARPLLRLLYPGHPGLTITL